jgi:ribokinase
MVVQASRLPRPGETLLGGTFITVAGGKGANQAVAAARLGARVTFVARVGSDTLGDQAIAGFQNSGIDTRYVFRDPEAPSGVALILIGEKGENMIVVAPGANARLSVQDIHAAKEALLSADVLVVQLEVPLESIEVALSLARSEGIPTILNPAPAQKLEQSLLQNVTYLTPNETEAALLTDMQISDTGDGVRAGRTLLEMGVGHTIITMGNRGALRVDRVQEILIPTVSVNAVDTTAAGDAFNGALAYGVGTGMDLDRAIRFANCAGALSVTKMGAQPSMPAIEDLRQWRDKYSTIGDPTGDPSP